MLKVAGHDAQWWAELLHNRSYTKMARPEAGASSMALLFGYLENPSFGGKQNIAFMRIIRILILCVFFPFGVCCRGHIASQIGKQNLEKCKNVIKFMISPYFPLLDYVGAVPCERDLRPWPSQETKGESVLAVDFDTH